jgi:hypothetical protein
MNRFMQARLLEVSLGVEADAALSAEDRGLLTEELALISEAGRYHQCGEEGTALCKAHCRPILRRLDAIAG